MVVILKNKEKKPEGHIFLFPVSRAEHVYYINTYVLLLALETCKYYKTLPGILIYFPEKHRARCMIQEMKQSLTFIWNSTFPANSLGELPNYH